MSYEIATSYIDSFVNYEHKKNYSYQKSFNLNKVKRFFKYLNLPYGELKVIHIAGTKGKGSTAHFCAYMLAASGLKVGLYTSPHLYDLRERIIILNKKKGKTTKSNISGNDFSKIISSFRKKMNKLKGQRPTYFEVLTAIAFKYFLDKKCDIVVLETGMGGRLDATNVVKPLLSVITHIGYDHTDILGKTLSKIAKEKAGIIKKRTPVICAKQALAAEKVVTDFAKKQESPVFMYGKDFKVSNVKIKEDRSSFDFSSSNISLKDIFINLKGVHQVENASLALEAVSLIRESNDSIFKKGLKNTKLEARFEVVCKKPLVVVDCAHNPDSFKVLANSLKTYFLKKKVILIFAASSDKDIKKMISSINYKYLILTKTLHPRAMDLKTMKKKLKVKAVIAEDVKKALKEAINLYKKESIIVISGSVFLAAQAKNLFKNNRLKNPCLLKDIA